MSDSVQPHRWQPTSLHRPWDSPGKNTGGGCLSNAWKWKVKVKSLSCVRLSATPWTAAYQAPPSMGFSRLEYWSGVPLASPLLWMPFILMEVPPVWLGETLCVSLGTIHLTTPQKCLRSCSVPVSWVLVICICRSVFCQNRKESLYKFQRFFLCGTLFSPVLSATDF